MRKTTMAVAFLAAWFFAGPTSWAQKYDDKEHAELAKALKDAKVSLQRGLTASAREGKPISAKCEVEDGKLQISVYTMNGDKFSEVMPTPSRTTSGCTTTTAADASSRA